MTEPCDLTAVEARRLIGRRKLSPAAPDCFAERARLQYSDVITRNQ